MTESSLEPPIAAVSCLSVTARSSPLRLEGHGAIQGSRSLLERLKSHGDLTLANASKRCDGRETLGPGLGLTALPKVDRLP